MILYEYYLVYPEGDTIEIDTEIPVNSILNIYGEIIPKYSLNTKTLCYYVSKKQSKEENGIYKIFYKLEQLSLNELSGEFCD